MEINIKEQVNPINTFILEVEFMIGDADGYEVLKVDFGTDYKSAEGLIHFLDLCKKEYPYGMGGDDDYRGVPGYKEYGEDFIPWEPYCDGHLNYQGYEMFWYDKHGGKYAVEISI